MSGSSASITASSSPIVAAAPAPPIGNSISESISDATTSSPLLSQAHRQHTPQYQVEVPSWQPDEAVEKCFNCGKKFTFWIRKHHCRKCGRVVCNSCSLNEITYLPSTYVVSPPSQIFLESPHVVHRTCDPCFEEIEMIRNALSDSLLLGSTQQVASSGNQSGEESSAKDVTSSRTIELRQGRTAEGEFDDEDSFRNRCPVCNKFIGCYAEQQKEEHINNCLLDAEFSGSPKQQRTNNRMLVYRIPKNSGISIPTIDTALGDANHDGIPSTSMDTLTAIRSNMANNNDVNNTNNSIEVVLSSSAKSGTSTLNISDDEKEDRECVICFEEFEPGDKVARMECLCVFHYRCIKDWFKKKGERECPVHTLHYV